MSDIKLKQLTLFIFESILIQDGRIIDQNFELQLNNFIHKCYNKKKNY